MKLPSIGRIVHFCYGSEHVPAIVTAAVNDTDNQTLTVFLPDGDTFTTRADHDDAHAPATWHWPEFVPEGAAA